jgi:hypothetical protein
MLSAQAPDSRQEVARDPFETVPVESRAEVKQAVGLIVKLHKERQWDRVYELLNPEIQASISRAQYLRQAEHYSKVLDFFPTKVMHATEKDMDWLVNGCAVVDDHGEKRKWESLIEISFKGDQKRIYLVTALKKQGGRMTCLQPPSQTQ